MKSREVVGQRIMGIKQALLFNTHSRSIECAIQSILLESGDRIVFTGHETEDEPFVTAQLMKARKK